MKSKLFLLLFLLAGFSLTKAQSNFIGSGIALEFDGDPDNYYNLGDVYNTLNFPVTFEAWVNQSEYSLYTPIFATDSYTTGNYYGLYIRFNPTGKLIFEIGSGTGAGGEHRRGKITSSSAPLNQWIHIAVVATTISDIKFYFNGVLQSSVNTDGTSGISSMVHNANPANLGRYATVHRADGFIGQMDESRLWNIARTETEIRQNMCKKLTGSEVGLIGYWIADESYSSSTLDDYSTMNVDGTEFGVVNKLTSGAPIGDESVYNYSMDYEGVSLSLDSPGDDELKINKIVNSPYGVHLYRVNSSPFSSAGLENFTDYYYGVFTANNVATAKYTMTYFYSFSNGVVNVLNETESSLSKRTDGSIVTWTHLSASLNMATDRLVKKNIATRDEFIFNINIPIGERQINSLSLDSQNEILISPNPSSEYINVTTGGSVQSIEIFTLQGKLMGTNTNEIGAQSTIIDVSNYQTGIYFVRTLNENGDFSYAKFEVINN